MDSYDILVVVLSVTLFVSLIVWISVGVLMVKILRKVKAASDTAHQAVENLEHFTSQLKNAGKVSAVGAAIRQVKQAFKGGKKNG